MPDLTIEVMQMCERLAMPVVGNINGYEQIINRESDFWSCTCPAFLFRKNKDNICKHLRQLDAKMCHYHEQVDGPPEVDGTCPKCGGKTVYINVGV